MTTKIDTEVAHVTYDLDTTFKVKRSKVNLEGAVAYCSGLPHSLLCRNLIFVGTQQGSFGSVRCYVDQIMSILYI